jgi:hypothetical protein
MAEETPRRRRRTTASDNGTAEAKPSLAAEEKATGGPKPRTPADKKLQAAIVGTYQGIGAGGIGIGMRLGDPGLQGTGLALIESADAISEAWMELADTNPKVKQFLKRATEVSTVGTLVALHLAAAMPLLISRGVIPDGFGAFATPTDGSNN